MSRDQPPPQGPYGPDGAPGPYGPPNPYGQSPQPPSAPPRFPPQPPGCPPQPGYPQGGFPPPPPPGGSGGGKGKTIGIVIGAVVVAGAIVGGFALAGGGDSGSGGITDDGKKYRLTAPTKVLDEYKSWIPAAGQARELSTKDAQTFALKSGKGIDGKWSTADLSSGDASELDSAKTVLLYGAYGEVADPEKSVDAYFAYLKQQSRKSDRSAEVVGSPEKRSPDGFENGIMRCQYVRATKETKPGEPSTLPVCVWGDYSTVGAVVPSDGSKTVSLDQAAKVASDLRKEVRVEVTTD
ncbi:hypothetical protein ABZS71_09005 [Streptomyces sp. NPDC005393]|uniref:hypothetical protein n=1 Tax=Streptomyces sp. NPDC005393 TaxID=3157041 RepID=UPI0033BE08A4